MAHPRQRLQLVQAFSLPETSRHYLQPSDGSKEAQLMNYPDIAPLLADVEWDLHPGPIAPHGAWYVETREEFAIVGAARLPIVREACESRRYDAIVLLGGGDPGFTEAREIGQRFNIPVTACAHAQMHIATMLGNKFSVIDISEAHNMQVGSLEELSVKAQRLLLVCRMISPQYFIAIVMAPEGNFGKARYLARLAQPALVAQL